MFKRADGIGSLCNPFTIGFATTVDCLRHNLTSWAVLQGYELVQVKRLFLCCQQENQGCLRPVFPDDSEEIPFGCDVRPSLELDDVQYLTPKIHFGRTICDREAKRLLLTESCGIPRNWHRLEHYHSPWAPSMFTNIEESVNEFKIRSAQLIRVSDFRMKVKPK
ncbi:unnamed protein product [Malus baccata var. baccata]